jgi:hypothetical protein
MLVRRCMRKRGRLRLGLSTSARLNLSARTRISLGGRDKGVDMMLNPLLIAQSNVPGSRAATHIGGSGFCSGFGTLVALGKE